MPPPLLLLPGTLCDERVFAPLLTRLHAHFPALQTAVVLTHRHSTLRSAADHILSIAPPAFALLGFSLGGILALQTALLAPARVLGLALLNTNAAPAPEQTHAARRAAVLQARDLGPDTYIRQHLWPSYVAPASLQNQALQDAIAAMAHTLGHPAFHHQTEAALTRPDFRPLLPQLTMSTLIQAGEHDPICPAAAQREVAAALPNATFDLIPDAGHFALLEHPDAAAESVAAWLHTLSTNTQPPQETP